MPFYILDSVHETSYRIIRTTLMKNSYFTTGYVNITVNLITGIIPLFTLGILNYRIYKCLLERRRQVTEIGLDTYDTLFFKTRYLIHNLHANVL